MKPKEFNKALRYLTSSATDKVKPKSNAKLVNTSKVQDSKPARARFFVNPVTNEYELVEPEKPDYRMPKLPPDIKPTLLDFIDKFVKGDPKTEKAISEYVPDNFVSDFKKQPKKKYSPVRISPIEAKHFYALEEPNTDRKKYEQSIVNPATKEGIASLLNLNNRKIK